MTRTDGFALRSNYLRKNLYKADTFFCTNGVRFIEIPLYSHAKIVRRGVIIIGNISFLLSDKYIYFQLIFSEAAFERSSAKQVSVKINYQNILFLQFYGQNRIFRPFSANYFARINVKQFYFNKSKIYRPATFSTSFNAGIFSFYIFLKLEIKDAYLPRKQFIYRVVQKQVSLHLI